jgi:uncharacterized protein YjbI with pentapeptide repeats
MKKLEEIETIDLSALLASGGDVTNLYVKKLVSTSVIRDAVIDSMYMGTCFLDDTEFVNCQFRNSEFYENEFRNCKFTNCLFENCRLKEQDFSHCIIDETRFEDCDLIQAYFYRSVLNSILFSRGKSDLSMFKNCTVDNITVTDVTFEPPPSGISIESLEAGSPGLKYLESYVVEADHE